MRVDPGPDDFLCRVYFFFILPTFALTTPTTRTATTIRIKITLPSITLVSSLNLTIKIQYLYGFFISQVKNLFGVLLAFFFSADSRADDTKCKNSHHDQNKNDTSIHNNVSSLFKLTINLCVFNDFFTHGIKKLFDRLVFVFFFLFTSFSSANSRANHTKR